MLSIMLISIFAIDLAFSPPFPIGSSSYLQPYPYESNPTAYAHNYTTPPSGLANVYDGDITTSTSYSYGTNNYVEITTFDNTPSPTFTIGRVDLKIVYKSLSTGVADDRYRITYAVGASSYNLLRNWTTTYSGPHRPDGNGFYTNATGDYTAWDEASSDGDTTFVQFTANNMIDTSTLSNPSLRTLHLKVASVKVTISARRESGDDQLRILLRLGTNDLTSGNLLPTSGATTYATYTYTTLTKPGGGAWTMTDVYNLQAGVKSVQVGGTFNNLRVTQLYVEATVHADEDANFPNGATSISAPAKGEWSKISEPNDGTWSWADILDLKVRIETNVQGTNNFLNIYIFEIWLSVYQSPFNPSAGVSIQPSSITKELFLNATKRFYVDIYGTNVANMWGYQINLGYDTNILTATQADVFSYSPFDFEPPEGAGNAVNDTTYLPANSLDDVSLYVDGFDNTKGGWTRYGVSPYLNAIDVNNNVTQAAAETLRPNGDGFYQNWDKYPLVPVTHYDKVNEVVADEDAHFLNASSANVMETLTLTNVAVPPVGGAITNVRVWARARNFQAGKNDQMQMLIRIGGSDYLGTTATPPATGTGGLYTEYWSDWAINPATGVAWTWANVNDLEAGVKSLDGGDGWDAGSQIRVTQLYVHVSFVDTGIGDFTFQNLNSGDVSSAVNVELFAFQPPPPLSWGGNDTVQVYVHDGSSYQLAGSVTPSNSSFTWVGLDVSSILNTNNKINSAKVYLVKQTDASKTPDSIRVDAIRLVSKKTGWTRTGVSPHLNGLTDLKLPGTVAPNVDRYNDTNSDNIWSVGEPAIRDVNNNGLFNVGTDVVLVGPTPPNGAVLKVPGASDKYDDLSGDSLWSIGEPAVRDVNGDGRFSPSVDISLVGTAPGVISQAVAGATIGDFGFPDVIYENLGKQVYIEVNAAGDGDDQLQVWLFHDNSYTLAATLTPGVAWGWVSSADIGLTLSTMAKINDARVFLVKQTTAGQGTINVDAMRLKVMTGTVAMTKIGAGGSETGLTGNGTLARIYFLVDAYGATQIRFGLALFTDPTGGDLVYTTRNFYFDNRIPGDITGPENPGGSGRYPPDGIVDGRDLIYLGANFGTANPVADFTGPENPVGSGEYPPDGIVDGRDLIKLGANFGRHL
jgi:hypothetical protein